MKDRRNGTGSGNVKHATVPVSASDSKEIKAGDIVAVTDEVLKAKGILAKMTPRCLIEKVGWPNEFVVRETFEHEKDGFCLKLEPCCDYLIEDLNTVRFRCGGHHAFLFKKIGSVNPVKESDQVEVEPAKNPGDRLSSVSLPWLGEVASMVFSDDEQNPRLTIKTGGKATVLTGPLAKIFAAAAKDNNLL
jgi:hypothetical protein